MVDMPLNAPLKAAPARSAWAVMRSVLFALFLRELKGRLDGRWSSAFWVIGEPLFNLGAMLLVYAALRAASVGGVDTLLFLVSGLLPFQLFRTLVLRLMEGIDANQGLFAYRQVKPVDALLARAGVEVALIGGMTLVCAVALAWLGHSVVPERPLELMLTSVLLVLFSTAIGLLLAVATSGAFEWLRAMVRMVFFPLYLATGVVMPLAHLPQVLRDTLLLNPVAHLLESIRSAFLGAAYHAPEGVGLRLPLLWTLVVTALALSLYRVRRDRLMPQ